MIISIRSDHFNAVQSCAAGEDEIRTYLHGWHLDHERRCIVATNGIILLIAHTTLIEEDPAPAKHNVYKRIKLPNWKEPRTLYIDTEESVYYYDDVKPLPLALYGDRKFVDWGRVYDNSRQRGEKENSCEKFSLDPAQLLAPSKALKAFPVLEFGITRTSPVQLSFPMHSEIEGLLMPVRC